MDYLTGELPAPERAVFEEHIAECPDCKAYLVTYRETIRLSQAACREGDGVPSDVPEDLVRAIVAAQKRPRK
jgi:anti-sigma factor RsiW